MKKVKLSLVGLDGNAFCLMGAFRKAATQQGWDQDEIREVLNKCTMSDYNNLLCVLSSNCEDVYEN